MASKEGCMFVAKDDEYFENMKPHLDVMNSFFESSVIRHAENACTDFLQDRCIVMVDYCTADGKIAIETFKKMIALIRSKDKSKEVMLIFEDKLENDYNKLLTNVLEGVILKSNRIFAQASSTSMFNQCLPSASVHFIFSSFGIHYLSKRPSDIKNGMLLTYEADEEEKLVFGAQAAVDWQCFLCHRSKELLAGGYMFIISVCDSSWLVYSKMNTTLNCIFKDHIISQKEYKDIMVTMYVRNEEELRRPFTQNTVTDLEIVSLEINEHTLCVAVEGAIKEEDAAKLTRIMRTFSCQSILNNLDSSRTEAEKESITHEFYRRLLSSLSEMKEDCKYKVAEIVLRKKTLL